MAVTTSSATNCPPSCEAMRQGYCYALFGPLSLHWAAVSSGMRGTDLGEHCAELSSLPAGDPIRLNQAGDLPATRGKLRRRDTRKLAAAVSHLEGWTYTHHPPTEWNLETLREISPDVTVNLSADSLEHVDTLAKTGLPTVVTVPADAPEHMRTPAGRAVVVCPEQTGKAPSCKDCLLCAASLPQRPIIAFRAHGTRAKVVS